MLPVDRLSTPTTEWPSASSASVRCEPRKPAAPVTMIFFGFIPSLFASVTAHALAEAASAISRAGYTAGRPMLM